MKLVIENRSERNIVESDDLTESLALVDGKASTFALLESDDGHFIQTANDETGFIVEKQLGSPDEHYEAVGLSSKTFERTSRPFWRQMLASEKRDRFDLETVVACFDAFRGERTEPPHITWRRLDL